MGVSRVSMMMTMMMIMMMMMSQRKLVQLVVSTWFSRWGHGTIRAWSNSKGRDEGAKRRKGERAKGRKGDRVKGCNGTWGHDFRLWCSFSGYFNRKGRAFTVKHSNTCARFNSLPAPRLSQSYFFFLKKKHLSFFVDFFSKFHWPDSSPPSLPFLLSISLRPERFIFMMMTVMQGWQRREEKGGEEVGRSYISLT